VNKLRKSFYLVIIQITAKQCHSIVSLLSDIVN